MKQTAADREVTALLDNLISEFNKIVRHTRHGRFVQKYEY